MRGLGRFHFGGMRWAAHRMGCRRRAALLHTLGGVLALTCAASAAAGTLSGTVTESGTGAPLADATVQAFCWQVAGSPQGEVCGETRTAGDGTYSLSLAPGSYKVRFDRWPSHDTQFYGGGRDLLSPDATAVAVGSDGSTSGIDAALKPLRTITGTVTGSGAPPGAINVTAYQLTSGPFPSWEPVHGTVTAPDGSYALYLPDGTYRIGFSDAYGPYGTVFFDGAATVEQADDVVVAGTAVAGIDAELTANHPITGTVTVDGVIMPAVAVTAWQRETDGSWEAVEVTQTGDDGTYALYLPDGTYRVEFKTWQARFDTVYYDGASSLVAADDVVVAGAAVSGINATISSETPQTGPAISGKATVSTSGEAAVGVNVTAWRWNGDFSEWVPVRQTTTGPDGTYRLYVPEGTYRVGFRHSEGRYQEVYFDGARSVQDADDIVVPGDGVADIDAVLVEAHAISGVITADDHPDLPPGETPPTIVTAWRFDEDSSEWERVQQTFAAPDGRYALYVPDGTYRIGFTDFFGAYQQPLYFDGVDTLGDARDVVVAGLDVPDIDAHLVLDVHEPPPTWPGAVSLSDAGRDAWGPRVAVDPNGRATAVWSRQGRVQARTWAADGSWSPPTTVSDAGTDALDPQVAAGPPGTIAVWRGWDGTRHRVQASTLSAKGDWSAPVTLSGASGDAWDPQVAVGVKGRPVVTWRQADGDDSRIQASSREPNGSWSSPVSLSGADAWDPHVAVGTDGAAIVVWSGSDGTNSRIQTSTRSATGPWSSPVTLSDAGDDAREPRVAAAAPGEATVVWRGWDGANDRIRAASRRAAAWSAPVAVSAAGRDAYDPDVAAAADGTVTAVWVRWDTTNHRVQAASLAPGGFWSPPAALSRPELSAESPQIAAGPDGAATAIWRQSDGFSESVLAATRPPGESWSAPAKLTRASPRTYGPHVAVGADGTLAAVWERREDAEDRVQGVVRIDPLERRADRCRNEFGVDMNVLFGVPEQFVLGACTTITAGTRWRPLALWYTNTFFETVPPGFVPAAATPLGDLMAKLRAVKVVVDPGSDAQRTVTLSPAEAVRTDRTFDDYSPSGPAYPMAVAIPRMAPLAAGQHTARIIWTLKAEHCDGFTDEAASSCLPSGDVVMSTRRFSVVSP